MLLKLANAKQPANATIAAMRVRQPAMPAMQAASVTSAIARSTPGGIRQRCENSQWFHASARTAPWP